MLLRPRHDLLRAPDRGAVVELEDRDRRAAGQLLGALAPGGLVERGVGQEPEAIGAHDLGVVAGVAQRPEGVPAGMAAGARRLERAVTDVELHGADLLP